MHDVETLYRRYARTLYRFALGLSGNPAEAEDLVADAFVRLWAAPGGIGEATVKASLFAIVRNLFLGPRAGDLVHAAAVHDLFQNDGITFFMLRDHPHFMLRDHPQTAARSRVGAAFLLVAAPSADA